MWAYKDISKAFQFNVYDRYGKTTIDKLYLNALEYITLKLFNKYKDYMCSKVNNLD